ncbi:serine hydrolase domain-containing protein [soil metagenome]
MTTTPDPLLDWPNDRPDYADFAAAVHGESARWHVPGLSAAILRDGDVTTVATGVINLNHPVPVKPETRFQVGSISKVFTATTVMMLVEQGKLDLDAPVINLIPDLPLTHEPLRNTITLRHLLNHSTGFEGDVFPDNGPGDDALERAVAEFGKLRVWAMPGEVFAYCNSGFYLAGRLIEIAFGQPYEAAVTELVLDPAGLEQTTFPSPDLVTVPTASGHAMKSREAGYHVYRPWALPRTVNAAGGVVSTVTDLLRFAAMHMKDGETVISADSARQMRNRSSKSGVLDTGYGIGWNIRQVGGATLVGHGGATNGFRAQLTIIPDRDFAIAMLSNGDAGSNAMASIERWGLEHLLDIDTSGRQESEVDISELEAVSGEYHRHDARISVWRVDDHLHIERRTVEHGDQFSVERSEDDPPTAMEAWPTGEAVFKVRSGANRDALIEFFGAELVNKGSTPVMRSGGRLAERVGNAPAGGPTVRPER